MERVSTIDELRGTLGRSKRPIGLVPTMGALHEGHLSLIRAARASCATVVTTIFVNPSQFGPSEDFARYPRPIDDDMAKLESADVDLAFIPAVEHMYPTGFCTTVNVQGPSLPLEGELRPGHFDGVASIVLKLLLQALPDQVYFGQKDAQQVAVIKRLVHDLDVPVEIVVCPTVRENDGLAVSSRNQYLTNEQRTAASVIYRALAATRDRFRSGQQAPARLEDSCREILDTEPLLGQVDYVAIVDPATMSPWGGHGPCVLLVAAGIGGVRLIDNVVLD